MEWNDEDLKLLEQLASVYMTEKEISEVFGIDEDILDDPKLKKVIRKGQLLTELKVRKAVFEMAARGSSPAQLEALKMIKKYKLKDYEE